VPASVETVIKQVAEGNFTGGTQKYGLKDGAAGIAPFHQFDSIVPQEVKDTVEDAKQKILSGEIKIALTRAEIPDLMD
jgi:basic membrane protein A